MSSEPKIQNRRWNNRLPAAMLLSLFFLIWAAVRPLDVGHDTALYVATLNGYFAEDGVRFPDIVFNGIAITITSIANQIPGGREFSGRIFLLIVTLIECVLMMVILSRKKNIVESILIAFSYGPLMFLDIIRQGVSMLMAGAFFSGTRRRPIYIIGAFAAHIISIISLLTIPPKKGNRLVYVIVLSVILILSLFVMDRLIERYNFYARTVGYLAGVDSIGFSVEQFSVANIFVFSFFFYSAVIRRFTKFEASVLSVLYLVGIFLPLFYRVYLFYFFCLSCSRDVLVNSKKIKYLLFDIGYVVILLRFSLSAFYTFDR